MKLPPILLLRHVIASSVVLVGYVVSVVSVFCGIGMMFVTFAHSIDNAEKYIWSIKSFFLSSIIMVIIILCKRSVISKYIPAIIIIINIILIFISIMYFCDATKWN
jgi:hypothetical protein